MTIREQLEQRETQYLSPYASLSRDLSECKDDCQGAEAE